jgi:hypothetical protein
MPTLIYTSYGDVQRLRVAALDPSRSWHVVGFQESMAADSSSLVDRARKHLRRGETRKALVALREACAREEEAAWLWTLYGAQLARSGRREEAGAALRHALWLRRTSGDAARARSTKAVLDRVLLAHAA